jgi:hypothetical protein
MSSNDVNLVESSNDDNDKMYSKDDITFVSANDDIVRCHGAKKAVVLVSASFVDGFTLRSRRCPRPPNAPAGEVPEATEATMREYVPAQWGIWDPASQREHHARWSLWRLRPPRHECGLHGCLNRFEPWRLGSATPRISWPFRILIMLPMGAGGTSLGSWVNTRSNT